MNARLVRLDDDVSAALRAAGMVARSARVVTGTPAPGSERATLRVVLADGRVVKARRHSRIEVARRHAALVGSLRDLPLSPVLARHARVTIEAWIEGRPLSELPRTSVRLAAAADVLGRLHATRRVGRRDLGGRAVTRPFADDLARRLEALHQEGAVTATESDVITRALGRLRPPRARTGLTHNDFCAENIVEDVAGRLQVVDNGGLRPGFLDFDLARCWYRWPMPAPAWRTFLAAYRRRRATTAGCEHERFWRLAAIVRSAHFRVVRASPDAALPLVRLRRFAREESAP